MEALGQRSDSASWKALNVFTAALENQDAEALRALFSPNTRRSTDLDTPIAELLALTKGRRIRAEWDGLCGSGMSTHDGRRIENAFFHFDLPYRDNRDADAPGLTFHVLRSDYVTCDESYVPPGGTALSAISTSREISRNIPPDDVCNLKLRDFSQFQTGMYGVTILRCAMIKQ